MLKILMRIIKDLKLDMGVEVFLRQGDKLVTFIQCGSRDYVYKANEVVKM